MIEGYLTIGAIIGTVIHLFGAQSFWEFINPLSLIGSIIIHAITWPFLFISR